MDITTTPPPDTTVRRSWVEPVTAGWSALAAVAGALWLAVPGSYPEQLRQREMHGSLVGLLDPTLVSTLLLTLGGFGVLAAILARRRASRSRSVAAVAVGYAVVFGLLTTDLSLLVAMGYSTAIFGPPVLFGLLVAASVRRPRLRGVVGAIVAAGALLVAASGAGPDAAADFASGMAGGLARSGTGMLLVVASFVGGALWLLVGLRAAGLRRGAGPSGTTYPVDSGPRRDWGWWVTVLAAAGPLPYALLRMTWLTPWPVWMSAAELEAHPEMRIFGLSLGFAAIGGSVLTAGLVMRWGSVYPRWIPTLGGRPVSPTWPTVLAVVVGAAITVAGRSTVQMLLQDSEAPLASLEVLVIMPFPVWGPLLVAAALAYYRRRTASAAPAPVPVRAGRLR